MQPHTHMGALIPDLPRHTRTQTRGVYPCLANTNPCTNTHTRTHPCSSARVEEGAAVGHRAQISHARGPRVPAEAMATPAGSRGKRLANGWTRYYRCHIRELPHFSSRGTADVSTIPLWKIYEPARERSPLSCAKRHNAPKHAG